MSPEVESRFWSKVDRGISCWEPVSCQVNLLRGETRAAANVIKLACPQDHPYDDANTYVDKRGARSCRECKRARHREYMTARRAAA